VNLLVFSCCDSENNTGDVEYEILNISCDDTLNIPVIRRAEIRKVGVFTQELSVS
jgi:hypothetical protein